MNYFGHAAVASWADPSPGKSLGAMLPDFATMCSARLGEQTDPEVTAGVALHHRTDSVFHQAAPVLALMRELDDRLAALGCARGPRRAVAHIGTELLLDATLLDHPEYRDGFLAAFSIDRARVVWREGGERFEQLWQRMTTYGVPDDLREIDSITYRLQRILAGRPLLAPNADDVRAIARGLAEHRPRVEVASETVLRVVRAGV